MSDSTLAIAIVAVWIVCGVAWIIALSIMSRRPNPPDIYPAMLFSFWATASVGTVFTVVLAR